MMYFASLDVFQSTILSYQEKIMAECEKTRIFHLWDETEFPSAGPQARSCDWYMSLISPGEY